MKKILVHVPNVCKYINIASVFILDVVLDYIVLTVHYGSGVWEP